MSEPLRVAATEINTIVSSGNGLLVCAYDDDDKFKAVRLEGAISLTAFKEKLPGLPKDQEMFFYCA